MKIAVTYENGEVFQHFGHTEQFKIYEIEDGKIISQEITDTNGSGHGALAGFLKERSVDALICGGIGGGAKAALAEAGAFSSTAEFPGRQMTPSRPFYPAHYPTILTWPAAIMASITENTMTVPAEATKKDAATTAPAAVTDLYRLSVKTVREALHSLNVLGQYSLLHHAGMKKLISSLKHRD